MILEHKMRDKHQNEAVSATKLNFTKDWNRSRPIRRKSRKGSRFETIILMKRLP